MKSALPSIEKAVKSTVQDAAEDAEMLKKIRRILRMGKNVEIRQDAMGNTKVFKVSREIEK